MTSGYLSGYGSQVFYRSADGIAWEALASADYVASHPIVGIEYGRVLAP
ncbi:MAG: hypothetical protein AB7S26_03675 [Sandaracinaceae bacterium]